MDYKYIEQLLARYFDCLTTVEEEQILRSFFSQEEVPAHLMQYRELFVFQVETRNETLSEDFDSRMLSLIEQETKQTPRIISLRRHLAPLFRAAAIVIVILSIGNIAEHSISASQGEQNDNATAINPYIKSVDIESAVQIKDESRAEASPQSDSLLTVQPTETNEILQ